MLTHKDNFTSHSLIKDWKLLSIHFVLVLERANKSMICRTKPVARKALLSQYSLIMCGWSEFSSFDCSRTFDQHVLYSFSFPPDCSTINMCSTASVFLLTVQHVLSFPAGKFLISAPGDFGLWMKQVFSRQLFDVHSHSRTYVCWNLNNLVLIIYWYGCWYSCKSFTWLDFFISQKVLPWYASFHWMTVWHALV